MIFHSYERPNVFDTGEYVELLKKAAQKSDQKLSNETLIERLTDEGYHTWFTRNSVMVVEEVKTFNIWLYGGKLADLPVLVQSGMNVARSRGCDQVVVDGRPGWDKVLEPYGFEKTSILQRKAE